MNKAIQTLRFTRDPEVRYAGNGTAVAKFSGAVDRKFVRDGEDKTDFFNYVAFGKTAEFIEKYFTQGMKALVVSHPQNERYKNKDGIDVTATKFIVDEIEFCEKKNADVTKPRNNELGGNDDFLQVNDSDLEELPFL